MESMIENSREGQITLPSSPEASSSDARLPRSGGRSSGRCNELDAKGYCRFV